MLAKSYPDIAQGNESRGEIPQGTLYIIALGQIQMTFEPKRGDLHDHSVTLLLHVLKHASFPSFLQVGLRRARNGKGDGHGVEMHETPSRRRCFSFVQRSAADIGENDDVRQFEV